MRNGWGWIKISSGGVENVLKLESMDVCLQYITINTQKPLNCILFKGKRRCVNYILIILQLIKIKLLRLHLYHGPQILDVEQESHNPAKILNSAKFQRETTSSYRKETEAIYRSELTKCILQRT